MVQTEAEKEKKSKRENYLHNLKLNLERLREEKALKQEQEKQAFAEKQ